MIIIDAHLDLAMNAIRGDRNLLQSAYTIRTLEQRKIGKGSGLGTVALPEMRRGRIAVSVVTTVARSTGTGVSALDYSSPEQAYGMAQGQFAYYRGLEYSGHVRVLTNVSELDAHMAEWEVWDASHPELTEDTPPLGFVFSMESTDPVLDPAQLEAWWDIGLRLAGPTHYGPGRYAGGTGTELGLTEMGVELVQEMDRLGIILDLTHLSDQAFWQSLDNYSGIVMASHNNCRALVPHQRQFSDEQLNAIIERDGVVGAAFDDWMLLPGWINGQSSNLDVPISKVVDHIDHVCQLAGNSRHAAIGTDLDGGYGREQSPYDLDTITDLQKLPDLLADRGYSTDDVDAILHGNWLRLFRTAWSD